MSIEYQAIVSCNTCGSEIHREELAMRSDFAFHPPDFLQGEWNPHVICCEECEDVITADLASAFLNSDVEGDEFANFNSIIDLAAEYLSSFQGYLNLDGLTELSDISARHLANHVGDLELLGIGNLSDTGAQYLAKHSTLTINLDNLPPSAAQIFRNAGYGVAEEEAAAKKEAEEEEDSKTAYPVTCSICKEDFVVYTDPDELDNLTGEDWSLVHCELCGVCWKAIGYG